MKLNGFYGKQNQHWELIYKASRDGFDPNAFHTRCDNKGSTITIVRSNNNFLSRGYTAVAWTSDISCKNDITAFLFTLTNLYNIPPTKYSINSRIAGNAVYHNISYGSTFGEGHDLQVAGNSNSNNSSYMDLPNVFIDTIGKDNNTFSETKNYTASDIEVLK